LTRHRINLRRPRIHGDAAALAGRRYEENGDGAHTGRQFRAEASGAFHEAALLLHLGVGAGRHEGLLPARPQGDTATIRPAETTASAADKQRREHTTPANLLYRRVSHPIRTGS